MGRAVSKRRRTSESPSSKTSVGGPWSPLSAVLRCSRRRCKWGCRLLPVRTVSSNEGKQRSIRRGPLLRRLVWVGIQQLENGVDRPNEVHVDDDPPRLHVRVKSPRSEVQLEVLECGRFPRFCLTCKSNVTQKMLLIIPKRPRQPGIRITRQETHA